MKLDPRLSRNYKNLSSLDQKEIYQQWADTYDRELLDEFGYKAPEKAVEKLIKIFPDQNTSILDAGCGTGLVGKLLKDKGYQNIDGFDLSVEMLEKARLLNVYKELYEADLSHTLEYSKNYHVVICVGVFSHNPEHPVMLAKLLNFLFTDGLLITTVNGKGWKEINWDKLFNESMGNHGFILESIEEIPYLVNQKIDGKLLVIRSSNSK